MRRRGGDLEQVAERAYDASAAFGTFMTFVQAIVGTLISLLMIGIGIAMLRIKESYTGKTEAKITAAKCKRESSNSTTCVISYEYTVDGKKYTTSGYTAYDTYSVGDKKTILYDTNNPENNKFDKAPWTTVGWVLIAIGIFILIGVWFWFYVVRRFKVAAAASGVGNVVGIANATNY
jgi:hypothetical protein